MDLLSRRGTPRSPRSLCARCLRVGARTAPGSRTSQTKGPASWGQGPVEQRCPFPLPGFLVSFPLAFCSSCRVLEHTHCKGLDGSPFSERDS
ncbi:hypothetical protein LEMLEM_LOCUS19752 [Lemmus lemmus]